jgi:hypothetical protein
MDVDRVPRGRVVDLASEIYQQRTTAPSAILTAMDTSSIGCTKLLALPQSGKSGSGWGEDAAPAENEPCSWPGAADTSPRRIAVSDVDDLSPPRTVMGKDWVKFRLVIVLPSRAYPARLSAASDLPTGH